jgi:hypothetical protein
VQLFVMEMRKAVRDSKIRPYYLMWVLLSPSFALPVAGGLPVSTTLAAEYWDVW